MSQINIPSSSLNTPSRSMSSSPSSSTPDDPYRIALGLFINKQFSDSVDLLEPILLGSPQNDSTNLPSKSRKPGSLIYQHNQLPNSPYSSFTAFKSQNGFNKENNDADQSQKVPHAQFVKLWNLYFAILNIAVEQSSVSYRSKDEILESSDSNPTADLGSFSTTAPSGGWNTSASRKKLAALARSGIELWDLVAKSSETLLTSLSSDQYHSNETDSNDGLAIPIETVIPLVSLISRHTQSTTGATATSNLSSLAASLSSSLSSSSSTTSAATRSDPLQSLHILRTHVEHYLAALPEKEQEIFFNNDSEASSSVASSYGSLESFFQLQVKLTEIYITKILFPLHEYEYAEEIISVNSILPDSKKLTLINGLKSHQQNYERELQEMEKAAADAAKHAEERARAQAKKEQEEAEKRNASKSRSKSKSSKFKKSSSRSRATDDQDEENDFDDDSSLDQALSTISGVSSRSRASTKSTSVQDSSYKSRSSKKKSSRKSKKQAQPAKNSGVLAPVFKTWRTVASVLTFQRLVTTLGLIAFIVSVLRATALRKKARESLHRVWLKLMQTARMGAKVSYV